MKRILAVYDIDPFYAERFAEYANQKETIPFTVMAFSSVERLIQYSTEHEIELLLVNGGVGGTEYLQVNFRQVAILSEGDCGSEKAGVPVVYKYQSADHILREVMACYQVEAAAEVNYNGSGGMITGVYSPVNRCGKTSFSLAYAQTAAKESRTLYVNLETCSGLAGLMGKEGEGGLSDLLYYYRHHLLDRVKLSSVIYSVGELDYIPPVRYPEDLCEMNAGELVKLIRHISFLGNYRMVIVDLGSMGYLAAEFLASCEAVFMPVLEDSISQAKIEEFETWLEQSGRAVLKDKLHRLTLPPPQSLYSGRSWAEQLLWGELGDYVRHLLRGRPDEWRA